MGIRDLGKFDMIKVVHEFSTLGKIFLFLNSTFYFNSFSFLLLFSFCSQSTFF